MIRDCLIPAIKTRFPNVPFRFGEVEGSIASLDSPCATLGRMEIHDDGDEVTIYLGNVTHGHFGCYDEKLIEGLKAQQIAEDVIEFVDALLKDRVVVWRLLGGVAGGWRLLEAGEAPPKPSLAKQQFLWSREIT